MKRTTKYVALDVLQATTVASVRDDSGRVLARALLHGSELSAGSPVPQRESPHSVAVGHPETGHRVENPARELRLHPLSLEGATPHANSVPDIETSRTGTGSVSDTSWGATPDQGLQQHDAPRSGAMHQRRRLAPSHPKPYSIGVTTGPSAVSDLLDRLKTALADRYAIEREIGAGGMATVYLAEDLKLHRKVALKVLRPELAAALGPERFLREIEIAAKLHHPHILPLHDSGEVDGFLYYVMPYVEGESLRDRLNREKQLPLDDALQLAREVVDALSYAHSHNVIHRDIKPENILLEAGHAVIADFGIARAVTAAGGERLTETGVSIGTPHYMSPEQCEGASDIDGRTDIYALGSVLYELLAGEPPYTGPTAQAVIAKRLSEPVPHVSTLRETVPPTVEAAINNALAKAPADRFSTIAQFAEALSAGASVYREIHVTRPVVADIPNNLPNPATRFFGREKELKRLTELLTGERLVTIQGPGGCGKTRLAIEVARQSLNSYPDGAWFVSLAQLTNPNLVADAVAEALRITPERERSIEFTIANRISNKRMLVVLDNCEHLIDECARILDLLMTHTQVPSFLATSRETVRISGEAVFSTPSLPFPQATATVEEIVGFDSVLLFCDRVLMNKPAFQLDEHNGPIVSSICQKLDGIPLAIEMAASRVKVMDPETILNRLSDQFRILSSGVRTAAPRHQTLQATIDWSNDLLTEEEQILFHRLSIFAGHFDLKDAEQICGFDPLSEPQVLDLLTQLLDKSLLVTVEEDRAVCYTMLEITKQYGKEKLTEKGELNALQDHYCNFYLAKTRVAYEERLEHSVNWLGWLQRELHNLQGALSILHNDPRRSLELASLLGEFFYLQGRPGIGREILGSALANYSHRDANKARALCGLGNLEVWFLDFEAGLAKMDEGIEIVEEIDDARETVNLFYGYGLAKTINKEWDEAKRILEEGLRISQSLGDPWLELRYKTYLNWIPISQLQADLIEDDVKECLQEAKKKGNPWDIALNHHMYADVPLQKGDFRLSEQRYIEAEKNLLGYQSTLQVVIEMQGIAMSVAGQGRHEKGLRLFGASIAKFEEMGAQMVQLDFWITCINRTIGKAIETVGAERAESLDGEGRQMGFERAIEYAFDVARD